MHSMIAWAGGRLQYRDIRSGGLSVASRLSLYHFAICFDEWLYLFDERADEQMSEQPVHDTIHDVY